MEAVGGRDAPTQPQPGAPEERLYQLAGQLYRELRVSVIGLHTGCLSCDEAVDLLAQLPGFSVGSCRDARVLEDAQKRSRCKSAERAVFRYSKWPTQAITYRLGKDDVLALRREAQAKLGKDFDLPRFHLAFIRQGTIPSAYFLEELLRVLSCSRE